MILYIIDDCMDDYTYAAVSNSQNMPLEEIISYTKRTHQGIQILVEVLFEMGEIEKSSIISFLSNYIMAAFIGCHYFKRITQVRNKFQ